MYNKIYFNNKLRYISTTYQFNIKINRNQKYNKYVTDYDVQKHLCHFPLELKNFESHSYRTVWIILISTSWITYALTDIWRFDYSLFFYCIVLIQLFAAILK